MKSKRDRMMQCLHGEEYVGSLGSFWYHFPETLWEKDAFIKAHVDYYRETDIDFMKIMEEIRYTFDMKTAADWRAYKPPARNAPERLRQQEIIKAIADEVGGECMVYTTIFDPLRTVGITMGYAYIEAHIKEHKDAVSAAFRVMAESIAEYACDCLDAGADGIFFSSKGAEAGRFDEETFDVIVYTPDSNIGNGIFEKSEYTLLHICGFDTDIARYKEFPAAIVNWDSHHGVSLKEGADIFSDKIILGGMENHSGALIEGTREGIEQAVKEVVETFPDKKRLILGADCTLPTDCEHWRIREAMRALHK